MTDYEYIIAQCQKDGVEFWNDDILEECIHKVGLLSDKERKNLLLKREVCFLGIKCPFDPNFGNLDEKVFRYQDKLKDTIIESIPSKELVEILYGMEEDGIAFDVRRVACEGARGELRKRYLINLWPISILEIKKGLEVNAFSL